MRYASVCSGVEAASLAWESLGWKPIWFSEIEQFPCEVLKYRYPDVPNLGDMTKIKGEDYYGAVDLLVGGTPCQGFSVAGKQGGLDDERSQLCLTFVRLLETMRPKWFVWENVPGVFSTNGGRDFEAFIQAINEVGYGCAWRVLDAQYVRVDGFPRAVPQRRRRVFVVGHIGNDVERPAKVLFESPSLRRNTPPSRTKGERAPSDVKGSVRESSIGGFALDEVGGTCKASGGVLAGGSESLVINENESVCFDGNDSISGYIAPTLQASLGKLVNNQNPIICYENHANDSRVKELGDVCQTLNSRRGTGGGNLPFVQEVKSYALAENTINRQPHNGGNGSGFTEELAYTQNTAGVMGVATQATVRRLTPLECERLMGFPDNWTKIPYRGKSADSCPDSPRYKACGNSMCVNVMRWVGMRIELVERGLV